MNDKKYNGWTNYETWNVALRLDNDEGSHQHWVQASEEAWEEAEARAHWTREESAVFALADRLKEEIEENAPDLRSSLYADLLGAALSEVNWREIAEHYIEDVDNTEEEDEDEDEDEDTDEDQDDEETIAQDVENALRGWDSVGTDHD